jgi:TonB family protein
VLVLALLGMLAAPAPEAQPRVPGTRLRLGMTESRVLALGSFAEVRTPDARGMIARQGPIRFFGVPGEATCYFDEGLLARVRFEATGVSRHSQDYADGQLRRMGLERGCERDAPGDRACDWKGPAVRLMTEMTKDRVTALIERWPPREERAPDSLSRRTAASTPPARPPTPAVSRTAPASGAESPPRPSAAAREAVTARPAPAPVPAPVVTLPETLTISLTSRNAPDVWPRIVSSPPLDYPEGARRESIQGVVWVLALVEPDGRVSDAWVERSILELDTAALAWVSRSRFAPCERNGRPCRFHVRIAVRFTLY